MTERGQPDAQWMGIAEKFPATLAKSDAPETLKDGQTPEAYGLGIDRPNYLYVGTPSDGTVWNGIAMAAVPTNSPNAGNWRFYHNRLWGWNNSDNKLYYGAYGYLTNYILDALGYIPCDFESSNITDVIPFGNQMAVFKADCLYVVRNADTPGDGAVAEYLAQSRGMPTASLAISVDGILYWVNTYGVFAYEGQQIAEITEPIRDSLGAFASSQITSLRADFEHKRVVGRSNTGTQFIITPGQSPGLFDYSTSGFRFTTRTLVAEGGEPLLVDKVAVIYQYSAGDVATIDFDVKINDTWKSESQFKIRPADANGRAEFALSSALSCRKFALRITDMSESLYISKILIHVKSGGTLGYSNK